MTDEVKASGIVLGRELVMHIEHAAKTALDPSADDRDYRRRLLDGAIESLQAARRALDGPGPR